MQTENLSHGHREWPRGSCSVAAPPPSSHPACSLPSMPLIVLERGGPFLLTSLVLLFPQGPAPRKRNCCRTSDVTPVSRLPLSLTSYTHTHISLLPEGRQLTAGLRQRARRKGIHCRRRLYLLWKGTALLVSIALFSWCSGEHSFAQLIMWCDLFHIFFIAKQKEIEFINIINNMRYVRYWLSC